MPKPACPYLRREKIAVRNDLDLSVEAPARITVTWYCRHTFHGIPVALGESLEDAERCCRTCRLPRPQEHDDAD